jgi:hypothetical protein
MYAWSFVRWGIDRSEERAAGKAGCDGCGPSAICQTPNRSRTHPRPKPGFFLLDGPSSFIRMHNGRCAQVGQRIVHAGLQRNSKLRPQCAKTTQVHIPKRASRPDAARDRQQQEQQRGEACNLACGSLWWSQRSPAPPASVAGGLVELAPRRPASDAAYKLWGNRLRKRSNRSAASAFRPRRLKA